MMDIHIPADAVRSSENVLVKVSKPRGPLAQPPTYRSFGLTYNWHARGIASGALVFTDAEIHALLQEHGMDPPLPPCIPNIKRSGDAVFKLFHWHPHGYPGGSITLRFNWTGIACKMSVHDSTCYVGVYDMTPGTGERVVGEFMNALLKRHKEPPTPAGELTIYTAQRNPVTGEYTWKPLQKRLHRALETIYIEEGVKRDTVAQLGKFLASSAMYDKFGVTWKRVHLFHGKPGGGKSSMALALASKFGRNLAKLTVTPDLDPRRVENLFSSLPENTWLVIEDIVERDGRTIIDWSTFLNCLDGLTTPRGLVVFMTTNFVDKVDPALMRPGRVDCMLEFHLPGKAELRRALAVLAPDFAHEHDAFMETCDAEMSIAALQKWLFECVMSERKSILR